MSVFLDQRWLCLTGRVAGSLCLESTMLLFICVQGTESPVQSGMEFALSHVGGCIGWPPCNESFLT